MRTNSRVIKTFLIALVGVIVVFVVMNMGYFSAQVRYALFAEEIEQQSHEQNESLKESVTPTEDDTNASVSYKQNTTIPSNYLYINSLGISAPIQYATNENEDEFQALLRHGVVHYPKTASIGEPGNAFIFGHSSDYVWAQGNYKTVFALLPRIEKGAPIVVTDTEGNIVTYYVTQSFVAEHDDVQWLDQSDRSSRQLTLQTSYPVGTALRRWIVIAQTKE